MVENQCTLYMSNWRLWQFLAWADWQGLLNLSLSPPSDWIRSSESWSQAIFFHLLLSKLSFSVSHHRVIGAFVIGAEVVFINCSNHTKLVIDVLQGRDAVPHLDISFELLVDDIVSLYPHIRLLVIQVLRSVLLERDERLDWPTLNSDASGHHIDDAAVKDLVRLW